MSYLGLCQIEILKIQVQTQINPGQWTITAAIEASSDFFRDFKHARARDPRLHGAIR